MMQMVMTPYAIALLCMSLRGLQSTLALATMINTVMSFPMFLASNNQSFRLGSVEATFVLLVSYTIFVYSGAFLILIELFPMILRPRLMLTRVVDSLLMILALSCGIVLGTSTYVQDCNDYAIMVHCDYLIASSVLVILCAVSLTGSFLTTFVKEEDSRLVAIQDRSRMSIVTA